MPFNLESNVGWTVLWLSAGLLLSGCELTRRTPDSPAALKDPATLAGDADPGCYLLMKQLHDGKLIVTVAGDDWKDSASNPLHKGGIAGALDQLSPWLLRHFVDDKWAYSYYHSNNLVVRVDTPSFEIVAPPWEMTPETLITKP